MLGNMKIQNGCPRGTAKCVLHGSIMFELSIWFQFHLHHLIQNINFFYTKRIAFEWGSPLNLRMFVIAMFWKLLPNEDNNCPILFTKLSGLGDDICIVWVYTFTCSQISYFRTTCVLEQKVIYILEYWWNEKVSQWNISEFFTKYLLVL